MKVSGFTATADIVGRRLRVSWVFVPEAAETIADAPPVTLRRKLRDYAFPAPGVPDPFLVYDAAAFPPAPVPGALAVTDLPSWEEVDDDGLRTVYEPTSVAVAVGARLVEVTRRTLATAFGADGVAVRQGVEILDAGRTPGELQPATTYYYQLFGRDLPDAGDDAAPYRSSALVTDAFGLNRKLYDALPEIYRRHDVSVRPATAGSDTVPEAAVRGGQLRRFLDPFGIALDALRGTAEGLRTLRDLDQADARLLPQLAAWIGWDLDAGAEIPLRRNELKAASRLYRLVGTLPGLRALVSQISGWTTQVAELAQNLALSNRPPQGNLFAVQPSGDGVSWHGADDAAELLGFATGNEDAVGAPGLAATLTGTAAEPFALRPGMELTVAVDARPPATVRFGPDDFTDLALATAAEVAAAVQRSLPELRAGAAAGRLTLTSVTVGPESALEVLPAPASLVSLEAAPAGRLSVLADAPGRQRVFYEAWEAPRRAEGSGPPSAQQAPTDAGGYALRRVHYKTWQDGAWRGAHPVLAQPLAPQGDPAAAALPDGRVWAAWLDAPQTDAARVRMALGAARPEVPARLLGLRREPFALLDGAVLTLTGDFPGVDRYTVHAADFADPARATAAEVVAAMNGQLTQALAGRERNGALRLERSGGARARLAVDLRHSTTARALGFEPRNATGTPGSWDEELDWTPPGDVPPLGPGRRAELAAVADPAGGVRLVWAAHRDLRWRLETAHWDERLLVGGPGGLFLRAGGAPWSAVAGLPSSEVRDVAVDADGTAWIATASGVALRLPGGALASLAPPLPSGDVRAVALARDGGAWFATGAGVALRAPGGATTLLTTAQGLPSNDARALAVTPGGACWVATAAGAALLLPGGATLVLGPGSGLPSLDVRALALAADGTLHLATAAGLAVRAPDGGLTVVDGALGLGASDARAVALDAGGAPWVATAQGVSTRAGGAWRTVDSADGLPSDDARAVAVAPDGAVWVGTAAGAATIGLDGTVTPIDVTGVGTPVVVRALHTGWSSPLELSAAGGGNREPALAVDGTGRTWALWSQRVGEGDEAESWALRLRVFDPGALAWGAEVALTTPPVGGRAADRAPAADLRPGGLRVYFSSDRGGGAALWAIDATPAGAAGPAASLLQEAAAATAPAPLHAGPATWLLFRSDRNVPLAEVGASPLGEGLLSSVRVPERGTLRRYAGSTSVTPGATARVRTGRTFGDLLCYTPNRPAGEVPPADDELYTRGTVGLYVSRAGQGSPLTLQEAARLRELLDRFIPANLRALVLVQAAATSELVYPPGGDLGERYADVYPFAEALGAVGEAAALGPLPWVVLFSNQPGAVSSDPGNAATWRGRTWFPPA